MKTTKTFFALALALALTLGLAACAPAEPEEETTVPLVTKTALPQGEPAAVAFYSRLAADLGHAKKFVIDTSYGIDGVQADNKSFKAAAPTLKKFVTGFLGSREEIEPTALSSDLHTPDIAPADVKEAGVRDVLEIRVAERMEKLLEDIAEGRNAELAKKDEQGLRDFIQKQMGGQSWRAAEQFYQIDIALAPAAADRLLRPADKAAVLAQLAKSKDYLAAQDYTLTPTELTVTAQVDKETDHFTEVTITEKAEVATTVTGAGALANEGAIPVSFLLTKTVRYSGIEWEEEKK